MQVSDSAKERANKILVVDDEPDLQLLVEKYFKKRIASRELSFVFARDGEEALDVLGDHPEINLVLTDLNMPRMDGLTLLKKLGAHERLLRAIVVSAYGDMENIRTAMNLGAFDFVTKPIDFDDLSITIEKTSAFLASLREADEIRKTFYSMKRDLEIARQIQTSVLPKADSLVRLNRIEISASMTPATEVGGDFYDFFQIDNDLIGFTVGDVSGKGIGAALFMAITRTALKSAALLGIGAAECVSRVNRQLFPESLRNMFVTLVYGQLTLSTGSLEYCNAGHNPPFIMRADGDVAMTDKSNGIGLCLKADFDYRPQTLQLDQGDTLILYTDGITETMNADAVMFGEESLLEVVRNNANSAVAPLIESVRLEVDQHSGHDAISDDMTLMALRYLG